MAYDEEVRDGAPLPPPIVDNADKGTTDEPEKTTEQTEQTQDEPAFDPRTAYQKLEDQLKNFQRELGQSRTMQSKLDKLLALQERGAPKTTTQDDIFKKYSPDVISESEALIKALWEKNYGDQFKGLQSFQSEAQTERIVSTFDNSARAYAGKDYEEKAVVPQDPVIFAASVEENVRYGRPGATDAEIETTVENALAPFNIVTGANASVIVERFRIAYSQSQIFFGRLNGHFIFNCL